MEVLFTEGRAVQAGILLEMTFYQIMAKYLEIDGNPYVMELLEENGTKAA